MSKVKHISVREYINILEYCEKNNLVDPFYCSDLNRWAAYPEQGVLPIVIKRSSLETITLAFRVILDIIFTSLCPLMIAVGQYAIGFFCFDLSLENLANNLLLQITFITTSIFISFWYLTQVD